MSLMYSPLMRLFVSFTEPSDRPCRLYFVKTFGEPVEQTWVEDRATQTFYGGYEFEQLPPMRRRGKHREQTPKQTVISLSEIGDCPLALRFVALPTCHFFFVDPKAPSECLEIQR